MDYGRFCACVWTCCPRRLRPPRTSTAAQRMQRARHVCPPCARRWLRRASRRQRVFRALELSERDECARHLVGQGRPARPTAPAARTAPKSYAAARPDVGRLLPPAFHLHQSALHQHAGHASGAGPRAARASAAGTRRAGPICRRGTCAHPRVRRARTRAPSVPHTRVSLRCRSASEMGMRFAGTRWDGPGIAASFHRCICHGSKAPRHRGTIAHVAASSAITCGPFCVSAVRRWRGRGLSKAISVVSRCHGGCRGRMGDGRGAACAYCVRGCKYIFGS